MQDDGCERKRPPQGSSAVRRVFPSTSNAQMKSTRRTLFTSDLQPNLKPPTSSRGPKHPLRTSGESQRPGIRRRRKKRSHLRMAGSTAGGPSASAPPGRLLRILAPTKRTGVGVLRGERTKRSDVPLQPFNSPRSVAALECGTMVVIAFAPKDRPRTQHKGFRTRNPATTERKLHDPCGRSLALAAPEAWAAVPGPGDGEANHERGWRGKYVGVPATLRMPVRSPTVDESRA